MAQGKKTYPAEFKRRMVELVRAGRSPEELGKELEPSANTIRKWSTPADVDEGLRADGLSTAERKELRELRRQVKQLEMEREILGKASVDSTDQRNTRPSTPLGVSDGKDRSTGTSLGKTPAGLGTLAERRVNLRHRSGCWLSPGLHLLDSPAVRWDLPTATA